MPDDPTPGLPGRVLAIDPGERWIGLALSDDERRLGLPLTTIDRKSLPHGGPKRREAVAIADAIRDAIAPDQPNIVVVGVPLRPDGTADDQAASFQHLGERIAAALDLPVALQNERRSNPAEAPVTADRTRKGGALNPAKKRRDREKRHALAAATILQRWLDAQVAPGLTDPLPHP